MFIESSSYIIPIFGIYHWIACYTLGGIISGLCVIWEFNYKNEQFQQLGNNFESLLKIFKFHSSFYQIIKTGKSHIFNNINGFIPIIGASGGVSALSSFLCCHFMFRLLKLVLFYGYNPLKFFNKNKSSTSVYKYNLSYNNQKKCNWKYIFSFVGLTLTIFNTINFFIDTIYMLSSDLIKDKGFFESLTSFWSSKVAHSAHLGGLLFGFFYYLIAKPKYI